MLPMGRPLAQERLALVGVWPPYPPYTVDAPSLRPASRWPNPASLLYTSSKRVQEKSSSKNTWELAVQRK